MILPWVETWRCPPPPSPLSLETLAIGRQSPRDSGTSLRSQELLQNLGFAAGIALRWGTGLGSLARRSGTANGAELRDRSYVASRRPCHERCVPFRYLRHPALHRHHPLRPAQLVGPAAIQPGRHSAQGLS